MASTSSQMGTLHSPFHPFSHCAMPAILSGSGGGCGLLFVHGRCVSFRARVFPSSQSPAHNITCTPMSERVKGEKRARSVSKQEADIQGSANPQTPGSENKRIKSCLLLPATGRKTQLFHLIFTEPGVCRFADPCMSS